MKKPSDIWERFFFSLIRGPKNSLTRSPIPVKVYLEVGIKFMQLPASPEKWREFLNMAVFFVC